MLAISKFSVFTSILFFNMFVMLIFFIRKNDKFIYSFSVKPIIFIILLGILRLILNFEFYMSIGIYSENALAFIFNVLKYKFIFLDIELNVLRCFVAIWIIGSIYISIKSIYESLMFDKYLLEIPKKISTHENYILSRLKDQNNIDCDINIVKSKLIKEPFIKGVFKGTIFISDEYYTDNELEHILFHELVHFKNKDSLKKILFHFVKIVFWWNPLVHILSKDMSHVFEIQCDLKVTDKYNTEEKKSYLMTINKVINYSISNNINPYKLVFSSSLYGNENLNNLKQRYHLVLENGTKNRTKKSMIYLIYSISFLFFLFSYSVTFAPKYHPPEGVYYSDISHLTDVEEERDFILLNEEGKYEIHINYEVIKVVDEIEEKYMHLNIYEIIRSEP